MANEMRISGQRVGIEEVLAKLFVLMGMPVLR